MRAAPFSCEQALALAAKALERDWGDVAVLLLVGFEAMLRTGEIFGLSVPDVMFASRGAVPQLTATKMGGRQARGDGAGALRNRSAAAEEPVCHSTR